MFKQSKKKGFTILELVIVIAVIGVLAAVLIPTFTVLIRKAKISGAEQDANNLSLILATDAAFDGASYFTADQVIAKANENGYSLESPLSGYAFFYDAAANKVVFKEVSEAVALADGQTFTRTVRNVLPQDNLFYVEQSDNAITQAIERVEHLAALNNYDRQAMLDYFDVNVKQNTRLNATVKFYLSKFDPRTTVYITNNGFIYDEDVTDYENAVVCADTTIIPKLKEEVTINIANPIVLPSYVDVLEDGSFTNVTATLELNDNVGYDKNNVSANGSLSLVATAAIKEGKIVQLHKGDYRVVYGVAKEGKDQAGVTYRINAQVNSSGSDYEYLDLGDLSCYQTSNKVIAEYIVPSISLVNNSFVNFGKIKKITVRAGKVNGGTEYVLVAVDQDYNVYKLNGVGVIDRAYLSYSRTVGNDDEVILNFGAEAAAFDNLSGMYAVIEYQYGHGDVRLAQIDNSTDSYVRFNGKAAWSDEVATFTTSALSAQNVISIDLAGKQVTDNGSLQNCNLVNVTKVTLYTSEGQAVYSETFDKLQTNNIPVTITLDNNLSGAEHKTTVINSYKGDPTVLEFSTSLDTATQRLLGWNTSPDGTGETYEKGATGDIRGVFDEDTTLYAVIVQLYVVEFSLVYVEGGSVATSKMIFDQVELNTRFTLNAQGDQLVCGGENNDAVFGERRTQRLIPHGFENFRWVYNGTATTGYVYSYQSQELTKGMAFDFVLTEDILQEANGNKIYFWGVGYGDVTIHLPESSDVVLADKDLGSLFAQAVEGSSKYYVDAQHTAVAENGSIKATTKVLYKDYYGE